MGSGRPADGVFMPENQPPILVLSVNASQSLIPAAQLSALLRDAVWSILGTPDPQGPGTVLWEDRGSALLLSPVGLKARCGQGFLLVELPVSCEETGTTGVIVTFGLRKDVGAGAVLTAERPPRGPRRVVDRWGDSLIALATRALQALVHAWARGMGAKMVAAGFAASADGLFVTIAEAPLPSDHHELDPGALAAVDLEALELPRFSQGG